MWRRTLTGITSELDSGLTRVVEQPWEFCGDSELVDLANSVASKGLGTPKEEELCGPGGYFLSPWCLKNQERCREVGQGPLPSEADQVMGTFLLLQPQRKGPCPIHGQT